MNDRSESLLQPQEHVLSTLEADGSRRWLTPRLSTGRFWRRRRVVAYVLLALYSFLPWIRVGGEQALLFDLPARRFTFFGVTFLPTDTVLLALLLLLTFLGIFAATALFGRVWCGWACPQTVYMEFVFRPLERLFTGRKGKGGRPTKPVAGWRRLAMYATYLVICIHLAQTFVAYFAGTDNVRQWIWGSPLAHPVPFVIVLALTVAMMIDFAFWREQLCIIGCPYGRFQSVLLDRWSKIVAYDYRRGEPRGKRKHDASVEEAAATGDCIDCKMCVVVCPTGIDIRDGLQLECVNCTQCMDACDDVMDKIGRPRGLVRYSSEAADAGEGGRLVRPRPVIYACIISVLLVVFGFKVTHRPSSDLTLMRSLGLPFVTAADGRIENSLRLKLVNRTQERRSYTVEVIEPAGLEVVLQGGQRFTLEPDATLVEPVRVVADVELFALGPVDGLLRVTDDQGEVIERALRLLGPGRTSAVDGVDAADSLEEGTER
ncbi:Ubp3 associated protein Bre5 [Planctomycetes bacterium Pla163]|uniref:Ubp3 associated protein Bre5 n=1 Tax=Rohdeia mirabilis TaxID=2528008 RepID=A0A518CY08_9BACT|nr:Ubp3 associated protein Bre5 [Planctomycetes bacterium Pla163]